MLSEFDDKTEAFNLIYGNYRTNQIPYAVFEDNKNLAMVGFDKLTIEQMSEKIRNYLEF